MIAGGVFGQNNEVPTRLVGLDFVERFVAATSHIHFAAIDGHEVDHGLVFGHSLLSSRHKFVVTHFSLRSACFGLKRAVGKGCEALLGSLECTLGFAFHLIHIVGKLFDAHHIAVVGNGHSFHSIGKSFVDKGRNGGLTVEDGILSMDVKVYVWLHRW